ncbi:MAG: hypothetical protein ABIT76_07615 [Chthoniobacterales bacterium]
MPDTNSVPTIEECVCQKWSDVREAALARLRDGESYVREEPLKAVAYAAAAGYVLRILPIGAIVRSAIRVVLFAVKPAALVYGAAKAYEVLARPDSTPTPHTNFEG